MSEPATSVVIGSNSFSGQDFIDLLLDDPAQRVIGVSRSPEKPDMFLRYRMRPDLSRFRFVRLDMNRDMEALLALLDDARPGYVVNFAAQSEVAPSWEHPEHWFETNTVALARLVNHLRRRDYLRRYLHVSSPEAYGTCVGSVSEEAPDNPSTSYAASKAAADMLVSVYQRQHGLPALGVRATNVYGARQQLFKIVCRAIIRLKLGRTIRLDGGGVAIKSYIHVRDVSKGERAILFEGEPGERYHLSPDRGVAVRDVVARICETMGVPFEEATETGPERPGQDAAYVIDSTKARQRFGWRPEVGLEEGIGECVGWIEANWEAIRSSPHEYEAQAVTAEPMPDRDGARRLVENIFAALPDLWRFHGRHQPVYGHLDRVVRAYFAEADTGTIGFHPFADVVWPRISLGALTSYDFFSLDEMVLHAFYWRNARRYATFFDVGAHIGIDALLAASLGYRVVAFEPDPENFRRMNEILALNALGDVDTHCKGISNRTGHIDFVRVKGNTTASHISGARAFYGAHETLSVETTTFDQVGHFPDLMKINVEGHETVVVSTIPAPVWERMDAFIEIHDAGNRDRIFDHFAGTGVNVFCQRIGWRKARRAADVPATNKEGYVFVSRRKRMPW